MALTNPGNQYHDAAGRFAEAPPGKKRPRTGHLGYDPRKGRPRPAAEPTPAPAGYHGPTAEQLAALKRTFGR